MRSLHTVANAGDSWIPANTAPTTPCAVHQARLEVAPKTTAQSKGATISPAKSLSLPVKRPGSRPDPFSQ
jgi:hypothetical protein